MKLLLRQVWSCLSKQVILVSLKKRSSQIRLMSLSERRTPDKVSLLRWKQCIGFPWSFMTFRWMRPHTLHASTESSKCIFEVTILNQLCCVFLCSEGRVSGEEGVLVVQSNKVWDMSGPDDKLFSSAQRCNAILDQVGPWSKRVRFVPRLWRTCTAVYLQCLWVYCLQSHCGFARLLIGTIRNSPFDLQRDDDAPRYFLILSYPYRYTGTCLHFITLTSRALGASHTVWKKCGYRNACGVLWCACVRRCGSTPVACGSVCVCDEVVDRSSDYTKPHPRTQNLVIWKILSHPSSKKTMIHQ